MKNDPRFDVRLTAGEEAPAATPRSEGVFSIAILGDFSGHAPDGSRGGLTRRRAWRVDRDDLDAAIAAIAPRVSLALEPNAPPLTITFASIEDFHPDRLAERVPLLLKLRELRAEAAAPGRPRPAAPAPVENRRADSAALGLSSGSLLDRIVDNASGEEDPTQHIRGTAPQDELSTFVDRAVRPHTVASTSAEQREVVAKIDEVLAATLRVVLHQPAMQALESLWRGVDFLVRRLDTSETMQVYLVDVARDELAAALEDGGAARWSLLVGAYRFGPDDLPVIARIAASAAAAGTPFIAEGDPRLAGTKSFAGDPDPDEWNEPTPHDWSPLRRSAAASHVGLALPRFLLRLPYGKRTDPCEVVPFEEMPEGAPDHESYLWGNPALACALAIGEGVAAGEPPPTHATIGGLPLHVFSVDGEATAKPAAEALLTQRAVAYLVDRGFTPLATARDGDSIVMARIQSLSEPARPLPIQSPA